MPKTNKKTLCCWCGYDKPTDWCPPYGMVCGEKCASWVSICKIVRFPEEKQEEE